MSKKRRTLLLILMPLLFITASLASAFSIMQTSTYKLDHLAYEINDYNFSIASGGFVSPYLQISAKEPNRDEVTLYNDLFMQYYYSHLDAGVRQLALNDVSYTYTNGDEQNLTLYTQNNFSVSKEIASEGGHRIEYGLFHAYFGEEILGPRGNISIRFDCDSFTFVSDKFADDLLIQYNLPSGEEGYKLLIEKQEYAVLNLSVDKKNELKLCINNIVYTDMRSAPRCSCFNDHFALFYMRKTYPTHMEQFLDIGFEIDLKSSPYSITTVINGVRSYGYSIEDYNYNIYTYDSQTDSYYFNDAFTDRLARTFNDEFDILFYVLFFLNIAITLVVSYLLNEFVVGSDDLIYILGGIDGLIFVIYSIVVCFAYNFYLFSVTPILLLAVELLFIGRRCVRNAKSIIPLKRKRDSFFELKI